MSPPRALAPLHHRGFRLFWSGQFASNIGDLFYAVALPWYVLAHHGGAVLLGTVLAAYGITRTIAAAMGGAAADRFRPWNVMMVTDAARALAVAMLSLVAATENASAATLIPIALILGAASGLFMPAAGSIVPSLLPDDELQAGNSLTMGSEQVSVFIGPMLGGVAVALLGDAVAFGIDAGSFLISTITLAGVRAYERANASDTAADVIQATAAEERGNNLASADLAGRALPYYATLKQIVIAERGLQILLCLVIAANLGMGAFSEIGLPALSRGTFHAGAGGYGALIAALGAGGVIGTLVCGQIGTLRRPAVIGSPAFVIAGVAICLIPYLGGVVPAAAMLLVFGATTGFGNTLLITAFQRWAPPHLMGRLMGLLMLCSFGLFPLSVLIGGAVVSAVGPAVIFPAEGLLTVVTVLVGMTQPAWLAFGAGELEPEQAAVA